MPPGRAAAPGKDRRTLIRNARQLLTLYGASGSRRGPAMSDLGLIPNGALLICNGVIEEAGPSRRVENLAAARNADEIEASGKVVMPAFCDPDMALVVPPSASRKMGRQLSLEELLDGSAIRVASRHSVEIRAAAAGLERARYGCVTAGSHTACATDLKNATKVLRVQKLLQHKPLRIRSVFTYFPVPLEDLASKWLPALRKDKLSSVIDLMVGGPAGEGDDVPRDAAIAASGAGFALRFRSVRRLQPSALLLALSGGAISIVAPVRGPDPFNHRLGDIGCVRVVPASEAFDDGESSAANIRAAIDDGAAIALSSSYSPFHRSSFNMQFILYLAVRHLGMTPEEAIVATTYNAACSLRMSHVTGSLEPGKSADLVMMDVPDYRDLPRRAGHHDLGMVMRAGQIVSRRAGPLILD